MVFSLIASNKLLTRFIGQLFRRSHPWVSCLEFDLCISIPWSLKDVLPTVLLASMLSCMRLSHWVGQGRGKAEESWSIPVDFKWHLTCVLCAGLLSLSFIVMRGENLVMAQLFSFPSFHPQSFLSWEFGAIQSLQWAQVHSRVSLCRRWKIHFELFFTQASAVLCLSAKGIQKRFSVLFLLCVCIGYFVPALVLEVFSFVWFSSMLASFIESQDGLDWRQP